MIRIGTWCCSIGSGALICLWAGAAIAGTDLASLEIHPMEVVDPCAKDTACIDDYLWSLYERTPKIDIIQVSERRKAAIRRRGRIRTVTRTFTKAVEEDFAWKDLAAADKAGMSLKDYVIGGMDHDFKLTLYRALRALDNAGLEPGITSGFRDDYRQSIASGRKARSDESYHGGSRRGGYGHGVAADIVSVKGETRAQQLVASAVLWKWIDTDGKNYGIGRPYLDHDAPHVGSIDGEEYVKHRGGTTTQEAELRMAKHRDYALRHHRHHRRLAKRTRTARVARARSG